MKVKITESQLDQYMKECLVEMDEKSNINEALTPSDKSDIKVMIKKEIKDFLDITRGSQFETKVKDIVKDSLKTNKDFENKVVEITRNVLVQLYKQLWTRRSFWANDLRNSPN
jgi:hypothetical protein